MDKKERIKLHEMETKYYNELKEKHDIIYGSEAEEEKEDKFYDNLDMLENYKKMIKIILFVPFLILEIYLAFKNAEKIICRPPNKFVQFRPHGNWENY